jgi:hypothetical protein
MKTGPDDLGTVENELGSAKHENGGPTPSVPKMGPDALGTSQNESESVKHEDRT